jgi:hypothetical protein
MALHIFWNAVGWREQTPAASRLAAEVRAPKQFA